VDTGLDRRGSIVLGLSKPYEYPERNPDIEPLSLELDKKCRGGVGTVGKEKRG